MEQRDFRMPASGDVWSHYKGGLYTIVGLARDDKGDAIVVYTDYGWSMVQLAPLYVQRIDRFVQEVENNQPRFRYNEGSSDLKCRYLLGGAELRPKE